MRPVSKEHSAIRYPLDSIMGSEANVRLLRVLIHQVDSPLSAPDAARLAGLTPAGARRSLDRLLESGFVERVGSGRTPQYRLRGQEPLTQALARLFEKEGERYDSFLAALRKALSGFPEIHSAWIENGPMGSGMPIDMCVVADAQTIDWVGEELRTRLKEIEKTFDLIIEVSIFTRADAPSPGRGVEFIVFAGANQALDGGKPPSHETKDRRALLVAGEIAEMMRTDPSLIVRARHHLSRLLQEGQGAATGAIAEWRQLLETYSPRQIRQLLIATSSRANRLRQSSPFFAILTPEERDRVLAVLEETK